MDVRRLGKYEIRGTLGRGAMGTVYDGWDPLIARRVAIKTVPLPENPEPETAEEIARFQREAQAAGRLTHPNIVAVYDYGETSDLAYIVMEFVDGPSLKGLLDQQERFALPALRRVMDGLLAGLQFSHERGVVHRDIKPANIMLTTDGQAKIADFGIARVETSSMTQAGTMLGTPAYMSPEQFMGQVVDARSDVYSAGVVLYQLLTGERPFDGGLTAIMHKVLNTEPPLPSQLAVTSPPALDAVVTRAMAKRPEDRFPSASAFAAALRGALDADAEATLIGSAPPVPGASAPPRPAPARSVPAPAAPTPATPARRGGSRVPLLAGVAAVALLALGGGYFLTRPAAPAAASAVRTAAATTPPSPVAAATPRQLAMAGLAPLRQMLGQAQCSVAAAVLQDSGALTVAGLIGRAQATALREHLAGAAGGAPLQWQAQAVDPVFCPALDAIHAAALTPSAMALTLAGNRTALHDGERILPRVTLPDFAAEIRVDYLGRDGSVAHLFPLAADAAQQIAALPSRRFAPGERLDLGDAGPGKPGWEVGPPYGTDIIIAVASAAPLHLRHSPTQNTEDHAAAYLRDLSAAIAAARQAGTKVAATVMTVDTLAK